MHERWGWGVEASQIVGKPALIHIYSYRWVVRVYGDYRAISYTSISELGLHHFINQSKLLSPNLTTPSLLLLFLHSSLSIYLSVHPRGPRPSWAAVRFTLPYSYPPNQSAFFIQDIHPLSPFCLFPLLSSSPSPSCFPPSLRIE